MKTFIMLQKIIFQINESSFKLSIHQRIQKKISVIDFNIICLFFYDLIHFSFVFDYLFILV